MIKKYKFILTVLIAGFYNLNAQEAGYYNGTEGKTGPGLKSSLHEIIKGHVDFSYSDAKYILNYADADPSNANNVILFYTKRSQVNTSWGTGANDINREHVWAKSHGNFVDKRPMDGDAFNLHPEDASVNITRSNYDFDECSATGTLIPEANAYYTSTQFEPQDAAKGEVARTLFYMAVRYEGTDNEIDLEMIDQVGNYPNPKFGKLSTLLQWNNDFPPTDLERRRNERVFEAQRNRNPFIDHPEYADMIWGGVAAPVISIGSIGMTPAFPVISESATVSASISTTAGSISSAILYYGRTYNSEEFSANMAETGGTWNGDIDFTNFSENDFVYYKITASDGTNSSTVGGNYRVPVTKTITPVSTVQGTGAASPVVGTTVTVAGIITANLDNTYYLQTSGDQLSGMCIFDIRRGKPGDSIVVTGKVAEYNTLTEIDNVSYSFNYGYRRNVEPTVLTIDQVNENYEGMLVTFENVTFLDGDKVIPLTSAASLTFTDGAGSMIVYARYNSRISGKVLPSGNVSVTGVISQYAGIYQLLVNDISDIKAGFDNEPPMITGVIANDKDWIEVSFNEKVDQTTAENISNYSFTNGLNIAGAYLYGGTKVLLLVTGIQKIDYKLTINGIKDLQGNTILNATKDFHSDFADPAYRAISCVNDTVDTVDQSLFNIDVISNDTLPTGVIVTVIKQPHYGTATVNSDFSINYETLMGGAPLLRDTIIYGVCNTSDPLKCGQAIVFITLNYSKLISCNNDSIEVTDQFNLNINVIANDTVPASFYLYITKQPEFGTATVENDLSISYVAQIAIALSESAMDGFLIYRDTITYKVCYFNDPDICLQASVFITFCRRFGI
jgi:endonuclease I